MVPNTKSTYAFCSIGSIVAIFVFGLVLPKGWNWFLVIVFMIGFVASIGKLITERFSGIFINERNKMSLSRFQLVIWTLIVLSAFLTIALERVFASVPDPLAIALPEQLWVLLGISTTSLVGSPLILSTKLKKKPTQAAIKKETKLVAQTLNISEAEAKGAIDNRIKRFGILHSYEKKEEAKFSDMFTGDEVGNSGSIDMAKVQMFFFTLIIAFSYMVLLVELIMTADPAGLDSFPELSDGLVALLGISSAGYLTNKTFDKTKT